MVLPNNLEGPQKGLKLWIMIIITMVEPLNDDLSKKQEPIPLSMGQESKGNCDFFETFRAKKHKICMKGISGLRKKGREMGGMYIFFVRN